MLCRQRACQYGMLAKAEAQGEATSLRSLSLIQTQSPVALSHHQWVLHLAVLTCLSPVHCFLSVDKAPSKHTSCTVPASSLALPLSCHTASLFVTARRSRRPSCVPSQRVRALLAACQVRECTRCAYTEASWSRFVMDLG